jgi:hypothetical protein
MIKKLINVSLKIKKKYMNLADNFSSKSYKSNLDCYKGRNQKNPSKIQKDISQGKVTEFVVWDYLVSLGLNPTKPDTTVYKKNKKSSKADIKVGRYDLHIKSQSIEQSKKYTDSWVFQPEDPLIVRPKKKDIIVLCIIDYEKNEILIKNVIFATNATDLYKDPKVKYLIGKKVVLYNKDL